MGRSNCEPAACSRRCCCSTDSQRCEKKPDRPDRHVTKCVQKTRRFYHQNQTTFPTALPQRGATRLSEGHPTVGAGRRPIGEPRCFAVLLSDMGPEAFPALTALIRGSCLVQWLWECEGGRPSQAGRRARQGAPES